MVLTVLLVAACAAGLDGPQAPGLDSRYQLLAGRPRNGYPLPGDRCRYAAARGRELECNHRIYY